MPRTDPPRALNVWDLRRAAQRRLPRIVWDYVEGGAEDDVTLRANRAAFEAIHFAPRRLVDVSQRSQSVTVLGLSFDSPFGIAPMSPLGLVRREADLALARAARAANVPHVLSAHADLPIERIAAKCGAAPWLQVYPPSDRRRAERELKRARSFGCEVVVVTVDVPVRGNREYNERNGFAIPLRLGARTVADGLLHPRWLVEVYLRSAANGYLRSLLRRGQEQAQARRDVHDWHDLAWLREVWPGKLVVKGILTADDARLAAEHGADAVVVSNHGGRQLDGSPATLEVLPQVVAAAAGRLAVFVDGGFRRGADIAKALALGAELVFIGRPAVYGVAAAGEAGVRRVLDILRAELDRVLALVGCSSAADLGPEHVGRPGSAAPRKAQVETLTASRGTRHAANA